MTDTVREWIERELVVERGTWASERAARVTASIAPGFETLVIWSDQHTAFTVPGRTIYFSRRLFERFADDDAVAFVIAHELAHHELGHVPVLSAAWNKLPGRLLLALLERRIAGPEHERDADLRAIETCLDRGYDLDKCIAALDILDQIGLDYGDVDGSIGPERGNRWLWSRRRGYFALVDRIAAVRAHAEAYRRGTRVQDDIAARRARRKQRVIQIAAASAVAAVALLVFRRPPR